MVICSNCGSAVMEGKFCEKCGKPLVPKTNMNQNTGNVQSQNGVCPNCGAPNTGGKFCENCGAPLGNSQMSFNQNQKKGGIFESISNSINSTASNMLSIKSDYNNNVVLYKVKKIPAVKEKTIKIEDYEVVFFNQGNGFTKIDNTFQTNVNDFVCFYMKKVTMLNNNFTVSMNSKIKKLDTKDSINMQVTYNISLNVEDIDKFFNYFTAMKLDSWTEVEVNSYMSSNIRTTIENNTVEMLKEDGNVDLRNPKEQISKFIEDIKLLIQNDVEKYGLKVNVFNVANVNINVNEINTILINNLYNGE